MGRYAERDNNATWCKGEPALDLLAIDASRSDVERRTGTEWYSAKIIDALIDINFRPDIRLYLRQPGRPIHQPRVSARVVDHARLWTHYGLSKAMRQDDPDALFVPSHVLPIVHPKASVVTIHDLGHRVAPEGHTRQRRAMLEITTRWNIRAAARIITPSAHTRDDLVRLYDVDPGRIDVVPHGVDHQRFQPVDRGTATQRLRAIGIDRPYVLFLSTIQPRKNVERLIEAFEQLQLRDHTLVLAGKIGWMSDGILARARSSSAQVTVLGHVPDDLIPSLYSAAAVFVLPSLYEGFGMGVLEAMACGCPVVISDRASLPEVGGETAIIVDPLAASSIADGISEAMQRTEELRIAGVQRAARFTWESAATLTLEAIERAWHESHA